MPDIQIQVDGKEGKRAVKLLQEKLTHLLGEENLLAGSIAAAATMKTLTATTLVTAVSLLVARPQELIRYFNSAAELQQFLNLLREIKKYYDIELTFTTPDGQKVDLNSISAESLFSLLANR